MIERGHHSWMIMIIHGQYHDITIVYATKLENDEIDENIVWSWILNSWRRAYTGSFCYRTFREVFWIELIWTFGELLANSCRTPWRPGELFGNSCSMFGILEIIIELGSSGDALG